MALTTCPSGHTLTVQHNTSLRYTCDVCGKRNMKPGSFIGCRSCDYDVCDPCTAEYDADGFLAKVAAAQESIRRVLENHRNPELPAEVHHSYDDKFALAELATIAAATAVKNALAFAMPAFGRRRVQQTLRAWAAEGAVTLRFSGEERCAFARTVKRKVSSATEEPVELLRNT